jgi:hypothetical protein
MKVKFYAYIAYMMVAIYLAKHFQGLLLEQEDEQNFVEDDFARLFNFDYNQSNKNKSEMLKDERKPQ